MTALDVIRQRIRDRGPLTVADFMSLALYHQDYGYYTRAARRTGRSGDFFTSVDVGPIFGSLLARQFEEMWRKSRDPQDDGFDLVEAAASNGQLARDVLDAARVAHPAFYDAIRLHLVESSPAARAAQRETIGPHADKLASSTGRLPDAVHGVIYANELLDALPVHRVVMTPHGLREEYVDLGADDRLVVRAGRPSSEALERYLDAAGVRLEPGWHAEINLAALAWIARAALSLHRGFLLLIDYGHPARELYSAAHAAGTLTTYRRHLSDARQAGASAGGPPWLDDPGGQDITSHVDLTSVQRTAEELGCTTLGVLDQTYFLLALGPEDERSGGGTTVGDVRRRLALKTLVLPGGLGSTHKVMVFARGLGTPELLGLSGRKRVT